MMLYHTVGIFYNRSGTVFDYTRVKWGNQQPPLSRQFSSSVGGHKPPHYFITIRTYTSVHHT